MEAARLMSCDITQIKEDLCQSAQDLAEKYHCTAVLKRCKQTIVAREDDLVYIKSKAENEWKWRLEVSEISCGK